MQELLPAELRGADTMIAPIGIGMSGAGVFRVQAKGGAYVLKVQPPTPAPGWRLKVEVQARVAAAGIAPRVVHVDEERHAVVSELVIDRGLTQLLFHPSTRPAMLVELGGALRKVHDVEPPDGLPDLDSQAMLGMIAGALDGYRVPAFARAQLDAVRAEQAPPSDRPPGLSHNDVNPTNLAYDGTRVVLLDWDTAARNEPLYDLAALAVFLRLDEAACLALLSAHDGASVTDLPARFHYDRRLIATLCGCMFLHIARTLGHPGGEEPIENAPQLADVYQRMRTGQLDIRTPDGQRAFGLALVRAAVSSAP